MEVADQQRESILKMYDWRFPPNTDGPHSDIIADLQEEGYLRGMSVLELGCFEGHCTCRLAKAGAFVTAIDIRPENLARAMMACAYHGREGICTFRLGSHEDAENSHRGVFDLLFHAGVLYHLANPVEHLRKLADRAAFPRILLETHVLLPAPRKPGFGPLEFIDGYAVRWFEEPEDWGNRLSGVVPRAYWLYRDDLLRLVDDCGLKVVRTWWKPDTPLSPRIALLLENPSA